MNPDTPIVQRLKAQLEILTVLFSQINYGQMTRRPASGKWSAQENLAHLARYHEVFIKRVERIIAEESPLLDRYRAEEDPNWPQWRSRSTREVLEQLALLRANLVRLIEGLSEDQLSRPGVHPSMGPMSLRLWLEFFLFHEGHHLYTIMKLLLTQSGYD